MDWLRRNWPDLIIGVALVAVIAGIVATLLSGGSFLSFGGQGLGGAGSSAEQPPAVEGSQSGQATGDAAQPEPQANPTDDAGSTNAQQSGIEPVAPDLAENTDANAPGDAQTDAQADAQTPAQSPDEAAGTSEQAGADGTSGEGVAAAGETGPSAAQEATAPIESPSYRVSVGAFASREGAQNLTERYSEQGLPTFVAAQGDLSLALVGPYASEEEANRVAQQITEDGGEALVYAYEPDGEASADASGAANEEAASEDAGTSQASTQEGDGAADAPATDSAEVGTGDAAQSGTFLQAGAFGSSESASFRRGQIEELGYRTSERETGAGLVRLFVGPLGVTELEEAQAQLQALGIDSFPVSFP